MANILPAGSRVLAEKTALLSASLSPPFAFLVQTSAQSIGTGAWTGVTFGVEVFDTHSGHSTSSDTSRYTAQVAGTYMVLGRGGFVPNSTGRRGVRITKNGVVVGGSANFTQTSTGDVWANSASAMVHLDVGEYVEVQIYQDSGGNLNSSGASADVNPSMQLWLLAPD